MPQVKQAKRILKIEVKRMDDESPDTSWLGEYSDTRTSEFSIDRAHDETCASVQDNSESVDRLERAISYLNDVRAGTGPGDEWEHIGEAQDILIEAQERLTECDCDARSWDNREYRYFNPSFNYVDKDGHVLPGNTPQDVRKYVKQDFDRMESLYTGYWNFIGIRAEAKIVIGNVGQTITSGGLWGIESDSDESYIKSVEQEELADLRGILHELGFSKRAIAAAVKSANV